MNNKINVIMLSKEDKSRLIIYAHDLIDIIEAKTKNKEEVAFLLKMLIESYEEVNDVIIPITRNPRTWSYNE